MSNALHDYAKLFERYAANNGGTGAIIAGEDCLALANEMRMDADAIEAENVKLHWNIASLEAALEGMHLIRDQDMDENAELRELCADMYRAFVHGNCYRWCEYKEPCNFIGDGRCQWYDRMRELEVEVDK